MTKSIPKPPIIANFTDDQNMFLKFFAENTMTITQICKQIGISQITPYKWKKNIPLFNEAYNKILEVRAGNVIEGVRKYKLEMNLLLEEIPQHIRTILCNPDDKKYGKVLEVVLKSVNAIDDRHKVNVQNNIGIVYSHDKPFDILRLDVMPKVRALLDKCSPEERQLLMDSKDDNIEIAEDDGIDAIDADIIDESVNPSQELD